MDVVRESLLTPSGVGRRRLVRGQFIGLLGYCKVEVDLGGATCWI